MLFLRALRHRAGGRWSTCAAGAAARARPTWSAPLLLAVALAGVILAFATADPQVAGLLRPGALVPPRRRGRRRGVRRAPAPRRARPLVPRGALRRTPAWGALLVSFFVGAALIAALIDIPIFARTTVYRDSQLMAALVLVRFLVALPVGAVVGGYLTRTLPRRAWSPRSAWRCRRSASR